MALNSEWFTEIDHHNGSAFSLKIKEKLLDEHSPFQHIEVYATEKFGNLMVIDGYIMLSDRDNFLYHEMLTHPVLFTHPQPRHVLIIGGGDCGTLREVLRHPGVETATQVEIDEAVTRAAERFFPTLCEANQDPRARLRFEDGIAWVKNAEAGAYDVIIVDSTDPVGPAVGLFSQSFYRDCLRSLGTQGLLAQQSESPLFHMDKIIHPMHDEMRAAGFRNIRSLPFPQCVYPSGWWSVTLAGRLGEVSRFREGDASSKTFPTQYYNADIHRGALAQPEFMRRALEF
ncbi:MAG: polyamine aminopropyltransferase [Gammaproteobacteria bacterium]|nr:polyamine aminopropyltransferase [Gammaproteobacteria bacterium]MCP5424730.1 polyamine aminopropyltransferase [Gammaproteobacteria bacterium]MCP5459235.1 polyamine aminopropyltransferase [Gammaproteobacteria bacterium]